MRRLHIVPLEPEPSMTILPLPWQNRVIDIVVFLHNSISAMLRQYYPNNSNLENTKQEKNASFLASPKCSQIQNNINHTGAGQV